METFNAVVQKVCTDGAHGPYAVTLLEPPVPEIQGSVTFDLAVWQEKDYPTPGEVVVLSDLKQKRAGWRAEAARYKTTDDQQIQQKERSTEMETKQTIGDMIEVFAAKPQETPTSAYFSWSGTREVARANQAMQNMDDEQRLAFLNAILELWYNC
jgi:hypothetical protein